MKQISAGAAVFAITFSLLLAIGYEHWRRYERLANVGETTTGTLIEKDVATHRTVRYRYAVGSQEYFGTSSTGAGNLPGFDRATIGQAIDVTYLPSAPGVSVAGDPLPLYRSWSGLMFGVFPVVSFVFAWPVVRAASRVLTDRRLRLV